MILQKLLSIVQCPTCQSRQLEKTDEALRCASCHTAYPIHHDQGYIDLMPRRVQFDYTSKYVAEETEIAEELDYRDLAPPLLAAGVRNRTLRRLLRLQPGDLVLDNGCGNGRFAAWNADNVDMMIGSDPATLFADAAAARVALVKADARVLPFADGSIDKAFSIDVLEHFPLDVIETYLRETARVLRPGGTMLIFSNTRERSPIQPIIDISRHVGKLFVRAGLYDFEREARRKSDHLKALETWDEVLDMFATTGLRPVRTVFWNSLFTTLVEHVLMKLGEAILGATRKTPVPPSSTTESPASAPSAPPEGGGSARELRARQRMRKYLEHKGPVYYALVALTLLMELDLWLFGRMRCGSYFVVVEKV